LGSNRDDEAFKGEGGLVMSKSQRRREIKQWRRLQEKVAVAAAGELAFAPLRRIVEDVRSGITGTGTSAAPIIREMHRQMKMRGDGKERENGILQE
jgi:hypothetical protein